MNIPFLVCFCFWFSLLSIFYIAVPPGINAGSVNYDFNQDLNTTGFNADEIDSGSFFSGVLGVFNSIGRFIGFVFFGLFLPLDLPNYVSMFFITFNTVVTMLFIGFIIDSVWSG